MTDIRDPGKIDLIGQDADGTYLLVMIEDRPWGADEEQEVQLRAKINTYAAYVLDGSLASNYPETTAKPVTIRLDCRELPSGHFAHITDYAATQLAALGIGFEVNPRT